MTLIVPPVGFIETKAKSGIWVGAILLVVNSLLMLTNRCYVTFGTTAQPLPFSSLPEVVLPSSITVSRVERGFGEATGTISTGEYIQICVIYIKVG